MTLELWTSSFCGACTATRHVLDRARRMLGDRISVVERNVADAPEAAAAARIAETPTVIVRDERGAALQHAAGVPTVDQVLVAVDAALA